MPDNKETEYFMLRERQERARAEQCEDVAARCVHLDMARLYRERMVSAKPAIAA